MSRLLEIGLANAALAAVLAPTVLLVGRIARRPALSHCLWLLVLLRLITPPVVGVPWPSWDRHQSTTPTSVARTLANAWLWRSLERQRPGSSELVASLTQPDRNATGLRPFTFAPRDAWPWVGALWLGGSATWFLVASARVVRFRRLLRHAVAAPRPLRVEAERLCKRLEIVNVPEVLVVPFAVSPLLWGMSGAARLVLPADLLDRLSADEVASLLAHELAHLRRRDHWVRLLEVTTLGVYWWNPVAWWARRELGRAEEQCCDAWVVRSLPGAVRAYARALVKTVDYLSEARPGLPLGASGAGQVSSLRRRIAMILKNPSEHRLSRPARLAALVLGLVVLPFAPRSLKANLADDNEKPAAQRTERQEPSDIDARLRRLERQLDRLANELGSTRRESKEDAETKVTKDGDRDTEKPKPRAEGDDNDDEEMEVKWDEFARRIEELIRKSIDPEKLEAMGQRLGEIIEKNIDSEKIQEIGEKIADAFKDGIEPKQLEELAKEIEETVKKNIDSKHLEELAKELGKAVEESFDTKKIDELIKDIQKKVKPDARDGSARTDKKPENAKRQDDGKKAAAERKLRRADIDLNRQIEELERKLEKLRHDLEQQPKDEEENEDLR
jgi:beta-lactamase regulating signal transducer with metallopeptidase domain